MFEPFVSDASGAVTALRHAYPEIENWESAAIMAAWRSYSMECLGVPWSQDYARTDFFSGYIREQQRLANEDFSLLRIGEGDSMVAGSPDVTERIIASEIRNRGITYW